MFRISKLNDILENSGRQFSELRKHRVIQGEHYNRLYRAMKEGTSINMTLEVVDVLSIFFDVHPFDFLEYVPDFSDEYVQKFPDKVDAAHSVNKKAI